MKKLLTIPLLALLASCGGKESESTAQKNILEKLTYTVDTVVVDAGEDFINIGFGLGTFDLTPDKDQLLFFQRSPLMLVTADLEGLKILSKAEFEPEGPNSVGSFIGDLKVGPSQQIFIKGFGDQGIFSRDGKMIEDLKIFPDNVDPAYANDFLKIYGNSLYDFHSNKFYAQPSDEIAKIHELWIIDPASKSLKSYPIPKMKSVSDQYITLTMETSGGTSMSYFGPTDYMEMQNEQLLISGGTMSGVYRMNMESDSIEFIDIKHQTVPNEWNTTVTNKSTNEATFTEDRKKIAEQLNYMDFNWDETREMYLRFGKKTFYGENRGDPSTYEIYLFAYDKDFNVLGETKLEKLKTVPSSYFWKEGKLYSYVNVEDELGFAVFTFDF